MQVLLAWQWEMAQIMRRSQMQGEHNRDQMKSWTNKHIKMDEKQKSREEIPEGELNIERSHARWMMETQWI